MNYIKTIITITLVLILKCVFAQNTFKINGEIKGIEKAKIILYSSSTTKIDTLGMADLSNGKFSLDYEEVNIEDEKEVYSFLTILSDKTIKFPIFLENTDIDIHVNTVKRKIEIKGGKLQDIQNCFVENENKIMKEKMALEAVYYQARANQDVLKVKNIARKISGLREKKSTYNMKVLEKNNNSIVSSIYLFSNFMSLGYENSKKVYENFTDELKNSFFCKEFKKIFDDWSKVQVGSIAPNFNLKNQNDEQVSLHSIKGKVKIIDFWASWCRPCRMENPNMKKLYSDFKNKGLEIISVSIDKNKFEWLKAVEMDGLNWINVLNTNVEENNVASIYFVQSIPNIFILDENNKIVAKNIRAEELYKKVESMLLYDGVKDFIK